jgi:cephalosporin hydroxylase
MAIQEIVWRIRPDLIIETGVARGGSLIFYASLLELMGGDRTVVGVDVEIRPHNRSAIAGHPLSHRIQLIEGSSIDPEIISKVGDLASLRSCVLVVLDSNHTHEHVLAELRAYSRFVTHGSYVVVLDTIVEDMPKEFFPDRPWGPGNNPRTAARMFLAENPAFRVDADIENKLLITVAPGGYLQRVR